MLSGQPTGWGVCGGGRPGRTDDDERQETWVDGQLLAGSDVSGFHPRLERLRGCGSSLWYPGGALRAISHFSIRNPGVKHTTETRI